MLRVFRRLPITAAMFSSLLFAVGLVGLGTNSASAAGPGLLSNTQVGELRRDLYQYPTVFGGLWGDPASHIATLSIVPGSSADPMYAAAMRAIAQVGSSSDPALKTTPKMWTLRIDHAGPSIKTLQTVMRSVERAEPWASISKSQLTGWGIDSRRHAVVVGVLQATPELAATARNILGNNVILTTKERLKIQDRLLDSPPYYGSDRIIVNGVGECTAGFAAYDPNASMHHGMLTSGHCFTNGTVVWQGYYDPTTHTIYYRGNIGTVTHLEWGQDRTDGEFLDAPVAGGDPPPDTAPYVWTGAAGFVPVPYPVSEGGNSFQGESVCFDGSFTLENCEGVITTADGCFIVGTPGGGTVRTCHQDETTSGSRIVQSGDSGGPVYIYLGVPPTSLSALGLITAGNQAGTIALFSRLTYVLNALLVGLLVNP